MTINKLKELVCEDPYYETEKGIAYQGDSRKLLEKVEKNSINLVITSPPFALRRQKTYGNKPPEEYNDWFMEFAKKVKPVLKDDGSFVIDIGGAWKKGKPLRSLYNFKLLVRLAEGDESLYHLAQDFYWYNPAKLPTPAQWVTVNKLRAIDSVNHVWWLSKGEEPKVDTRNVLQEYSDRQKELMEEGYESFGVKKRIDRVDIKYQINSIRKERVRSPITF